MQELTPDGQAALTDEPEAHETAAEQPPSEPEHAEPTEQPDEEDEPQAGSPS
jgi:hypothetical protein